MATMFTPCFSIRNSQHLKSEITCLFILGELAENLQKSGFSAQEGTDNFGIDMATAVNDNSSLHSLVRRGSGGGPKSRWTNPLESPLNQGERLTTGNPPLWCVLIYFYVAPFSCPVSGL
jgi:hypothetical protein